MNPMMGMGSRSGDLSVGATECYSPVLPFGQTVAGFFICEGACVSLGVIGSSTLYSIQLIRTDAAPADTNISGGCEVIGDWEVRRARMPVKVLVVEDEPLVRMLAVELIEDAGFEALEACNADEAILILDNNKDVRILMTDINMPGTMDGVRLATIARERFPLIEIVIVSGKIRLNSKQLPERSVFMAKPYDVHRLSETLIQMAA
jgi:CheY-like chemotaxis protein